MTKRSSNLSLFSRGGLLFIVFLAVTVPGCKKKAPPPPPQSTPLPPKTLPAVAAPSAAPSAAPLKPVQMATASARKATAKGPILTQITTAKRLTLPVNVNLDFTKRRDPFRPFVQMPAPKLAVVGKAAKSRERDPLPIQSFDTEKFRVTGIIAGLKENSALVIDPNGKGYVVKEGMLLGNNDGRVRRVTTSSVEVEESFRDDTGRVRKRLVKLTLLRKK